MTHTPETSTDFYAANAEAYGNRRRQGPHGRLRPFCARLAAGARVLELGCGSGEDSEALLALGFDVTPSDGTPEMARIAEKRLGRPVRVLRFEDIDDVEAYDGVWANACLLHVPREDLAAVLFRIRTAVRAGGVFYASYKTGGTESRDRFGRYYNRPAPSWLEEIYRQAGWSHVVIDEETGSGYDGEPTDWLHVTATH